MRREGLGICVEILDRREQRRQSQALLTGIQGRDKKQWAQTETKEIPFKQKKKIFSHEVGQTL